MTKQTSYSYTLNQATNEAHNRALAYRNNIDMEWRSTRDAMRRGLPLDKAVYRMRKVVRHNWYLLLAACGAGPQIRQILSRYVTDDNGKEIVTKEQKEAKAIMEKAMNMATILLDPYSIDRDRAVFGFKNDDD